MLKVAFSEVYKYQLPDGHRFPMIKYELLPEQLLYEGTLSEQHFFHPQLLEEADILSTHTLDYWHKLKGLLLSPKEIRAIGFPVLESLVTRGRYIAHGTYQCARYALDHGVSMNIAGGTHHAFAGSGEGFCVFNDIAIASNMLLGRGLVKQILIVDLDVHQGNGTAHIFQNNPAVFTFSMHGAKNYPLRKQHSNMDIGLPDECDDEFYLRALEDTLPRLIDEVQPDMIFYLAGVDVLKSDRLGRLALSKAGCKSRDEYVFRLCHKNKIPVAVTMGGGYSLQISDIIDAHANTFRIAQETYF